MASKIKINLDTSKENYILAKCKQNDDLTLEASIFENGLEKDLTNAAITIQALKADKTYIIQNTNITKENNKIIADLDRDFTRAAGKTEIEILLVESSKQNTTFSFCLEVVGSVIRGAVQSSNTVTILEELDNKIVEAGQVKEETEQLIVSGGAATKGDIDLVNAQLAEIEPKVEAWNDFKNNGGSINGDIYIPGFSNSPSGYTKLPNGFILQWGTVILANSDTNFYFPIGFPNSCLVVDLTTVSGNGGYGQVTWKAPSYFKASQGGVTGTHSFNYLAIGY